jgi:hypothetical protein
MNIFYLDENPQLAAQYHCDKHILKMPLETCQILASGFYALHGITSKKVYVEKQEYIKEICKTFPRLDSENKPHPYGIGFMNHPSTVWARTSRENYLYTLCLGKSLCQEFTYRYGKIHACEKAADWFFEKFQDLQFPSHDFTTPYRAMPSDCHLENPVDSYRCYYIKYKNFATWKKRDVPAWYRQMKSTQHLILNE